MSCRASIFQYPFGINIQCTDQKRRQMRMVSISLRDKHSVYSIPRKGGSSIIFQHPFGINIQRTRYRYISLCVSISLRDKHSVYFGDAALEVALFQYPFGIIPRCMKSTRNRYKLYVFQHPFFQHPFGINIACTDVRYSSRLPPFSTSLWDKYGLYSVFFNIPSG